MFKNKWVFDAEKLKPGKAMRVKPKLVVNNVPSKNLPKHGCIGIIVEAKDDAIRLAIYCDEIERKQVELPMRVITLTPEDFECPNPAVEGEVIE